MTTTCLPINPHLILIAKSPRLSWLLNDGKRWLRIHSNIKQANISKNYKMIKENTTEKNSKIVQPWKVAVTEWNEAAIK